MTSQERHRPTVLDLLQDAAQLAIPPTLAPAEPQTAARVIEWIRRRPEIESLRDAHEAVGALIVVAKLATLSTHGGISAAARMALEGCGLDPDLAMTDARAHLAAFDARHRRKAPSGG
ncbi:hypothetical protein [Rhodanobacter denitrificans]|uniref:hypothetical protein n=1 Tax=Rhodanobacter denitrificans TaxID=666685 RepID=UPI001F24D4BF|nr:hypothetical protein [Rhodanobacter denitrificans]UJJ60628.1 hypothetical protein LRK55_19530 [Rhodanobacter denitrificans]